MPIMKYHCDVDRLLLQLNWFHLVVKLCYDLFSEINITFILALLFFFYCFMDKYFYYYKCTLYVQMYVETVAAKKKRET